MAQLRRLRIACRRVDFPPCVPESVRVLPCWPPPCGGTAAPPGTAARFPAPAARRVRGAGSPGSGGIVRAQRHVVPARRRCASHPGARPRAADRGRGVGVAAASAWPWLSGFRCWSISAASASAARLAQAFALGAQPVLESRRTHIHPIAANGPGRAPPHSSLRRGSVGMRVTRELEGVHVPWRDVSRRTVSIRGIEHVGVGIRQRLAYRGQGLAQAGARLGSRRHLPRAGRRGGRAIAAVPRSGPGRRAGHAPSSAAG